MATSLRRFRQWMKIPELASVGYPASWFEYHPLDWWRRMTKGKVKQCFYNHVPARKIRARLPREVWENCYRFAIVRNPRDRVISQYFWRCHDLPELLTLPKAKAGFRSDRRDYPEVLTPAQRERIATLFGKEIELMDYKD